MEREVRLAGGATFAGPGTGCVGRDLDGGAAVGVGVVGDGESDKDLVATGPGRGVAGADGIGARRRSGDRTQDLGVRAADTVWVDVGDPDIVGGAGEDNFGARL